MCDDTTATHIFEDTQQYNLWQANKIQTLKLSKKLQSVNERKAFALHECASTLIFSYDKNKPNNARLLNGYFCRNRECPMCGWRNSRKQVGKFMRAKDVLEEQYHNHRWLFLTLTVKNCEPEQLRKTISKMNKGFLNLQRQKKWPAVGFIKSIEVTRNKETGDCHPHFHTILLTKPEYFQEGNYLQHQEWAEMWQKAMKLDYWPHVNIQASDNAGNELNKESIFYVYKYAIKPQEFHEAPKEWTSTVLSQLHGLRLHSAGGGLQPRVIEELKQRKKEEKYKDILENRFSEIQNEKGETDMVDKITGEIINLNKPTKEEAADKQQSSHSGREQVLKSVKTPFELADEAITKKFEKEKALEDIDIMEGRHTHEIMHDDPNMEVKNITFRWCHTSQTFKVEYTHEITSDVLRRYAALVCEICSLNPDEGYSLGATDYERDPCLSQDISNVGTALEEENL